MIISLVLGALLGAALVVFILQNVAVVTVTFMTWQMTGSLALVLLASIVSGVVLTLLILLPGLIRDDFALASLKREKKNLEDEIARRSQELEQARLDSLRTQPAVERPLV